MNSRLEERYRGLLRVLPRAYRQDWEEEMVAAFLESMATDDAERAEYLADYGRVPFAERMSVLTLAVRVRLGGSGRYALFDDAARIVALVGLLTNAVLAVATLIVQFWLAGALSAFSAPAEVLPLSGGLWFAVHLLEGLLWLAAYLAAITGFYRPAQVLAVAALAPATASLVPLVDHGSIVSMLGASLLLDIFIAAATVAALRSDAPHRSGRPWLLALPIGAVIMGASTIELLRFLERTQPTPRVMALWDPPTFFAILLVVAVLVHLLTVVSRRKAAAAWSLALTVMIGAVLVVRVLTLAIYWSYDMLADPFVMMLAVAEIAALVVCAVVLARRVARHSPALSRA